MIRALRTLFNPAISPRWPVQERHPFESPIGKSRFSDSKKLAAALAISSLAHFSIPIGRKMSEGWFSLRDKVSETIDRARLPNDAAYKEAKRELAMRILYRLLQWKQNPKEPLTDMGPLLVEASVFMDPETAGDWKNQKEKYSNRWAHRQDELGTPDLFLDPLQRALVRAKSLETKDRLGHWTLGEGYFNGCFFDNQGCNCYMESVAVAADLLEFKDSMIPKGYTLLLQSYEPWQIRNPRNPFFAVGHMRPVLYLDTGDYKTGTVVQLIEPGPPGRPDSDLYYPVLALHDALGKMNVEGIQSPLVAEDMIAVRIPNQEKASWETLMGWNPEDIIDLPSPSQTHDESTAGDEMTFSNKHYTESVEPPKGLRYTTPMTVIECCIAFDLFHNGSKACSSEAEALRLLPGLGLDNGFNILGYKLITNMETAPNSYVYKDLHCFSTEAQVQDFGLLRTEEERRAFLLKRISQFQENPEFSACLGFLSSPHTAIKTIKGEELRRVFELIREIDLTHSYEGRFLKTPPEGVDRVSEAYTDQMKPFVRSHLSETAAPWKLFYEKLAQLRQWVRSHPKEFVAYFNAMPHEAKRNFLELFEDEDLKPAFLLLKSEVRTKADKEKEIDYAPHLGPGDVEEILVDLEFDSSGSSEPLTERKPSAPVKKDGPEKLYREPEVGSLRVAPETIIELLHSAFRRDRKSFVEFYSHGLWSSDVSQAFHRTNTVDGFEKRVLFQGLVQYLTGVWDFDQCEKEREIKSRLPGHMAPLFEDICR